MGIIKAFSMRIEDGQQDKIYKTDAELKSIGCTGVLVLK